MRLIRGCAFIRSGARPPVSHKIPSPCIGVCAFKMKGRCIGCAMTRKQKKAFGKLDGRKRKLAFLVDLVERQRDLGRHDRWLRLYLKKCSKRGVKPPLAA